MNGTCNAGTNPLTLERVDLSCFNLQSTKADVAFTKTF